MFDKWYLLICVVFSSVSFLPLFFNGYGWEVKEQTCWYTKDIGTGVALGWEFGTYYIWVFLATAYCIVAITAVLKKIRQSAKILATVQNSSTQATTKKLSEEERKLRKKSREAKQANMVMKRVIWYPIVILGCNFINLVEDMSLSLTGSVVNFPMYIMSFIACASQGLLLSIMFLRDPALNKIWQEIKSEWLQKYYVEYNWRLGRTVDLPHSGSSNDGPSRTLSKTQEPKDVLPPTHFDTVMNWLVTTLFLEKNDRSGSVERSLEEGQMAAATELNYIPYENPQQPATQPPMSQSGPLALPTLHEVTPVQKPVHTASNARTHSNQVRPVSHNQSRGVPNDSSTASLTHMLHHRRGSASSFTSEDSETIPIELL